MGPVSNSIDFNLLVAVPDFATLTAELRYNIDFCAANKLSQSRKWLSELLVARRDFSDAKLRK